METGEKMNENPKNRGNMDEPMVSGNPENFQLNLTDEEIATGTLNVPKRKKQQPNMDTMSSRKVYYTDKERKQEEKEHKKRNKLKAGKNKRIFSLVWIVMVALVSLTVASYLIDGANDVLAVNRPEGSVEVTIPENVTVEQLTQILHENKMIDKPEFFQIYAKFTADMEYIVPGMYQLETNMDYEYIINVLEAGNDAKEVVDVTFPEGVNAVDVAKLLEENEVCEASAALEAMNDAEMFSNYEFISELGYGEDRYYLLEGYLFPDTYQFYKGEEVKSVLGKMLNNYKTRTKELEQSLETLKYSRDEIINIASIIQREAANNDDMYMVSAVLHNRLEWGAEQYIYTLGCDSTIYYPYRTRNDVPEDMAGYESNYNTYDIQGLPAGAICNPGMNAIRAAMNPSEDGSRYLYFCHAEDGTAYYAETEYEHDLNRERAGLL